MSSQIRNQLCQFFVAMKAGHDLGEFMKKHGIRAGSNLILPLVQVSVLTKKYLYMLRADSESKLSLQAPIFISFFMALRAMANTPVESMTQGGMLWFVDLTVQDQFYLLPLITCTTLYVAIQVIMKFSFSFCHTCASYLS